MWSLLQLGRTPRGPRSRMTSLRYLTNSSSPDQLRKSFLGGRKFPGEELTSLLDHDNHQMRKEFRKFLSDPSMIPKYNISLQEERESALKRLQRICDAGFISVLGTIYSF